MFNATENFSILFKKRNYLHVGLKTNMNQHDRQKQRHALLYVLIYSSSKMVDIQKSQKFILVFNNEHRSQVIREVHTSVTGAFSGQTKD